MSSLGDTDFLIPYDYLYEHIFASVRPLYYLLIVLWVICLFYCMYSIADRHFTWALEYLAKACRMSPDFAGLTLLAFGNGAPDFFTAIFGASEEPEMILGSSVGSGLFIVTVVFGLVLLMARKPGKDRILVQEDGEVENAETTDVETKEGIFKCVDVRHSLQPVPFLRSAGMYLLCVGLLFLFAFIRRIPFWLPLVLLGIYFVYLAACVALHFGFSRSRSLSKAASELLESKSLASDRAVAITRFQAMGIVRRIGFALKTTWLGEALEGGDTRRYVGLFFVVLKAPVNLLLNLTILPIENPYEAIDADNFVSLSYLHRWRCIANPFFSLLLYTFLLAPDLDWLPWYIWIACGVLAGLLSVALYFTTSWFESPRLFPLHVLYSFCTSTLWIYATSSELLACLSSTGTLLGISPTVMGILVLAWGNSFGDLVADVAIAKNGAFETAVTAIFSGPVQNVLLTIGAGFLVAAVRTPSHSVLITLLRSDIYIALVLLALVIVLCLVVVPFKYDFVVSRRFGIVLLTIYLVYLPCALAFGLGLVSMPFGL